MSLLDPYEPPFKPKKNYPLPIIEDNLENLEELNRPLVTEDYGDSKFADRKPLEDKEQI